MEFLDEWLLGMDHKVQAFWFGAKKPSYAKFFAGLEAKYGQILRLLVDQVNIAPAGHLG